jgi:hypothetical protein
MYIQDYEYNFPVKLPEEPTAGRIYMFLNDNSYLHGNLYFAVKNEPFNSLFNLGDGHAWTDDVCNPWGKDFTDAKYWKDVTEEWELKYR